VPFSTLPVLSAMQLGESSVASYKIIPKSWLETSQPRIQENARHNI